MTVIIGQILTVITSCSRHLPRDGDTGHLTCLTCLSRDGDTGHLTSGTQNNCSHQPDTQTLRSLVSQSQCMLM